MRVPTIDLHCDTLMQGFLRDGETADLYDRPEFMLDIRRLCESGAMAQCFAIFLPPPGMWTEMGRDAVPDEVYIASCVKIFNDNLARYGEVIARATNASEIRENFAAGKVSAILTLEDGRAVAGKLENLERFYDLGVRAISLTWNGHNCFGAPNSKDPAIMAEGLTDFGKEAIVYLQELGMLVDVSHLSDGGFDDVAELAKKPFVATHSNSRALSPHPRNLTDEMLRRLGEAGGVTGLNFAPQFLNRDTTREDSTAALLARHAKHIANVAGEDSVAIGSDFDGMTGELEIYDPTRMSRLAYAFADAGFTEAQIEKIIYKNALRVFADTLI